MNAQLIPVSFYEDTVVLVGQDSEPYVAMKSIVESMGLDWGSQFRKITEKFESTIVILTMVAEDGKTREMVCLPLRKLPAWLYSISPNKVNPELRDKIIRYQEECDDALWDYWNKGEAIRPSANAQTATARIANHRLRLSLAKELHRTRDPELRRLIHEQLADVSISLGLPVPELERLGSAAPEMPDLVKKFWEALAFLDSQGVKYNHAIKSNLVVAVNLPQLAQQLLEIGHPLRFDSELRQSLWDSPSPRCLHKNHVIQSAITGKSVKCWVFERPSV